MNLSAVDSEICSKVGCDKQAVEEVWADLKYYACEDHLAGILQLTEREWN